MKDSVRPNIVDSGIISYFNENGLLQKTIPSFLSSYQTRYIRINDIEYDMLDKNDVLRLPIPNFKTKGAFPDVTNSLDYILRMIAGSVRDDYSHELSILILKKACDMMLVSNIGWRRIDYYRLVEWLLKDGKLKEAHKYSKIINANIPPSYVNKIDCSTPEKIHSNNERKKRFETERNQKQNFYDFLVLKCMFPDTEIKTYYRYCKLQENDINSFNNYVKQIGDNRIDVRMFLPQVKE